MGTSAARALVLLGSVLLAGCGKKVDAPPAPVTWYSLEEGERVAARTHRPAVLFFRADWSVADKMLEAESFPAPEVQAALRPFVAIRVDQTDDELPEVNEASRRFGVVGVPTILVLDASHRREVERIGQFVEAPELARRLRAGYAQSELFRAQD